MKEVPTIVNKTKLRNLLKEKEGIEVTWKTIRDWEKSGVIKPFAFKAEGGGVRAGMYIYLDTVRRIYDYLEKHPRASQIIFSTKLYERRNGTKITG